MLKALWFYEMYWNIEFCLQRVAEVIVFEGGVQEENIPLPPLVRSLVVSQTENLLRDSFSFPGWIKKNRFPEIFKSWTGLPSVHLDVEECSE